MISLLEDAEEWLSKIPGGRWIATVVALLLSGGIFHVFDLMEKIPDASLWALKAIVAGDKATQLQVEVTPFGRVLVLGLYFGLVLVLCAFIFFHASWRRRVEARFERRYGGHFLRQAGDVYRWLGTRSDLAFTESKVTRSLVVKKNYDVEFTDRSTIRGDGAPLYAVAFELQSYERLGGSDRCEFRVKAITPDISVVCIPAEEGPNRCRYVVLLVPPLPADHPGVELDLWARWPKAARNLEKPGTPDTNTYFVKKRVRQPIDEVVFSVTVDLDGEFKFQHECAATDCKDSVVSSEGAKHYKVVARNLQPRGELAIRVTRRDKSPILAGD